MVRQQLGPGTCRGARSRMAVLNTKIGTNAAARDKGSLRVHTFVTFLAVAATVVVVSALVIASQNSRPHLLMLSAAVAAVLVGDVRLVEIRIGHNGNTFTWSEAALILGVSLTGWDWFIALGFATLLIRQLAVGRSLEKTIFNASAFATGSVAAELAFIVVSGHRNASAADLNLRLALAWVVAAAVYNWWVSISVSIAVAWSQDMPIRSAWQRGAKLRLLMFIGNSSAGLGTLAVGHWNRPTAALLPFFFLLLYLAYNNFLRAQQEGETWRQLHAATLSLKRIDSRAVLRAVSRGADTLFGSEVTEVVLENDGHMLGVPVPGLLSLGLSASGITEVQLTSASAVIAGELDALGLHSVIIAPLESVGRRLGVLVIGFRGAIKFKRRERSVFSTFADQTSISLQHARLFEELSAERSRLDAIVQHASDGILLVDGAGRVCSWNPAMTLMTGRNQAEALGMPLGDALNATTENGMPLDGAQLIADVHETEQVRLPVMLMTSDGRNREVALAVSPVPDAEGTGQLAVVVARDVTAQREVEQAKQDFIATVSHELRTPLTPIKGYLTLLLRPDFQPDEVKRDGLMSMMLEQTGQLERLVDDLLSVSRMQHGEFNIRLEHTDVREVVRRATRDFSSGSDRAVELRLPDEPAMALCDPSRLQQVVGNLLSNAEKYSPTGLPVHVQVRVGAHEVELSVRDEGDGVPIDQREVVFEPFRRLGDALTNTTRGTGLGLHIARQLIEAMNGRIWVDGHAGEGAIFHITAPGAHEDLTETPAAEEPTVASETVVLERHQALPSPSPAPAQSPAARDQLAVS
jgi:PAS domain S-box-containing protein